MKKLISALLTATLLIFSLLACTPPADTAEVSIAYLPGSTGIGMAKMIVDNPEDSHYTFTSETVSTLIPSLLSGSSDYDIAAIPTNAAAKVYNKTNGKYQVVALNTLGVLYIATNNGMEITDLNSLKGKTVYVPETAPGAVLTHVLKKNSIPVTTDDTEKSENNVYLSYDLNLEDLPTAFAAGTNHVEIALLPEPALSGAEKQAQGKSIHTLDLTAEWNKVEDTPLVQGCIVASSDFIENHSALLQRFLESYEASILYMDNSANISSAADYAVSLGIIGKKPIAEKAIPRCNLTYMDGIEMKNTLSAYLAALHAISPSEVGGKLPADGFYYVAD